MNLNIRINKTSPFRKILLFTLCILFNKDMVLSQTPFYPSNDEIKVLAQELASSYPDIVQYNEIGQAENSGDTIIAVKISDSASVTQDEPVWIFTGIIHGREKLGLRVLLDLAEDLTDGYNSDPNVKNWVDSYEIWLVFNMNPYGYKHNVRKNGSNLTGTDLNRNWNFRWEKGGSTDQTNSKYRGTHPESESETKAVSDLYKERRPIFGITFHQGTDPDGGQIMRPWSTSSISAPPDASVLLKYAQKYADMVYDSRLQGGLCESIGGGEYAIMDPDGSTCGTIESSSTFCKELCWAPELTSLGAYGQSSNWCYAQVGTMDFTVEISDRTFNETFLHSLDGPATLREEKILDVVTELAKNHTDAIKDMFQDFYGPSNPDKFSGTGITGHITDSITGKPIEANIEIKGYTSNYITIRRSEPNYGRYWRFLPAGEHEMEVSAYGYSSWFETVTVSPDGYLTNVDIVLYPWATGTQFSEFKENFLFYPNPVTNSKASLKSLNYDGYEYKVKLTTMQGSLVKQVKISSETTELNLSDLPDGIYLLTIQNNQKLYSHKLIIMRKN